MSDELPPLVNPEQEVIRHYIREASFYAEIEERGGMTAEEARQERLRLLARIGMGNGLAV